MWWWYSGEQLSEIEQAIARGLRRGRASSHEMDGDSCAYCMRIEQEMRDGRSAESMACIMYDETSTLVFTDDWRRNCAFAERAGYVCGLLDTKIMVGGCRYLVEIPGARQSAMDDSVCKSF